MLGLVARSSLVLQFRVLLTLLVVCLLWAAMSLVASMREQAALVHARATAAVIQALILQGETYRLQGSFTPDQVQAWKLIYPAQRSNDRFELAAVATFFGESSAASAAPVDRPRELYLSDDGARILYAARVRGPREEDMLMTMAVALPSSFTILSQIAHGMNGAPIFIAMACLVALLVWVRWYVLSLILTVTRYARRLVKARSGAVVDAPELHPDELTSHNEVHRISVALSAVARALRLRQAEEQA